MDPSKEADSSSRRYISGLQIVQLGLESSLDRLTESLDFLYLSLQCFPITTYNVLISPWGKLGSVVIHCVHALDRCLSEQESSNFKCSHRWPDLYP